MKGDRLFNQKRYRASVDLFIREGEAHIFAAYIKPKDSRFAVYFLDLRNMISHLQMSVVELI